VKVYCAELIFNIDDGSVPGASLEEASRACEAMTVAGTVLRHGAMVYLRPAEVLATINKVLPFNQEDIKNRLKEVDMNLGALEGKYAEITRGVKMRTVVINYAVLAGLAAQWGILFRLTYWELSWDVMVSVVCTMQNVIIVEYLGILKLLI
jgi:hypothetical protein